MCEARIALAQGQHADHPLLSFTAGSDFDAPQFLIGLNLNTFTLPLRIRTALESLRGNLKAVRQPALPADESPYTDQHPTTPILDLLMGRSDRPYLSLDFSKRSATQTLNQVGVNTFNQPLSTLRGTILVCNLERPINRQIEAQFLDLRRLVRQF